LNLALGIAMDPSYIWPEWGVVLAGVLISKCSSLLPEMTDEQRATKIEVLAQAELRVTHLAGERLPSAIPSVRAAAKALLIEWKQSFPHGLQPVVDASQDAWPAVDPLAGMSDVALQAEVDRLDRIMQAGYADDDRRFYRLSMERKDAWLVGKIRLASAASA